jgi:hypothetical protein
MIYKVQARIFDEKTGEFFQKLTDGTISGQKPDGNEIVSSMRRAKITGDGIVKWYETCYCDSPLQHERETVYDLYLADIKTELVDVCGEVEGESFWDYLQSK